jgi:hypothetical protein
VPATKNVRQGLFGTAMDEDNDDSAPMYTRGGNNGPSYSVSLTGQGRPPAKLVQPFSVSNESSAANQRPRSASNAGRFGQHDDRVERPARGQGQGQSQGNNNGRGDRGNARGRGAQGGQGAGGRRGGGGRAEGRDNKASNPKDLDADLDAYFASK